MSKIQHVRISGRGAKRRLWRQILADVLNVNLETTNTIEGYGYGTAKLAGTGTGTLSSVKQGSQGTINTMTNSRQTVANIFYYENDQAYQSLHQLLNGTNQSLARNSN